MHPEFVKGMMAGGVLVTILMAVIRLWEIEAEYKGKGRKRTR